MEQPASDRHVCTFDGCGKSFIRKEHLTRHAVSHTAPPSYICNICSRAFTRNDVLQRHIARHTAATDSTERNKRACQACHRAKTRCAGGTPCQSCSKRNLDCIFESAAEAQGRFNEGLTRGTRNARLPEVDRQIIHNIQTLQQQLRPDQTGMNGLPTSSQTTPPFGAPSQPDIVSSVLVSDRIASSTDHEVYSSMPPGLNSGFMRRPHRNPLDIEAGELYFTHFHPRWPIIHMASYDEKCAHHLLNFSIWMIGTWFKGPASRNEAITAHDKLMNELLPKLTVSWKLTKDEDSKSWAIFQSSLLNIIFSFYTGENLLISRGIVMLNVLVGVLREHGLFRPETAMPKFKPNVFRPWAMVTIENRKRLALFLFKIDAYIATFRSQPPLLRPEDMHFNLPNTYSFWNQRSLEAFDRFSAIEPIERSQTTIFELMQSPFGYNEMSPFVMFPEDIQIGICSMQSRIWEFVEQARDSDVDDATILTIRPLLVQQLEYWKRQLDGFSTYDMEDRTAGETHPARAVPDRYYWGLEDHSQPGWKNVVLSRPNALVFDTIHLYHLLSIHICTDVRNLCRLADNQDSEGDIGQRRISAAIKWASTDNARRALLHASAILRLNRRDAHAFGGVAAEPLTLMALYTGALVVWAYGRFGQPRCLERHGDGTAFPEIDAKWVETWGLASMDGLLLCQCMMDELVKRFAAFVPGGPGGWAGHVGKLLATP